MPARWRWGCPAGEAAVRTTEARRRAERAGQQGETLALWWLRLRGWRLVARGFRAPVGEIDLVVRRGRVLALVEVKRRDTLAAAAEAIRRQQQARIARAAEAFLQRRPDLASLTLRFDAVLLAPGHRPRHIIGAWETT